MGQAGGLFHHCQMFASDFCRCNHLHRLRRDQSLQATVGNSSGVRTALSARWSSSLSWSDAGQRLRAGRKIPERGCVVLDQPQRATNYLGFLVMVACCGWFRCCGTQPRSFFRPALNSKNLRTSRPRSICLPGVFRDLEINFCYAPACAASENFHPRRQLARRQPWAGDGDFAGWAAGHHVAFRFR